MSPTLPKSKRKFYAADKPTKKRLNQAHLIWSQMAEGRPAGLAPIPTGENPFDFTRKPKTIPIFKSRQKGK